MLHIAKARGYAPENIPPVPNYTRGPIGRGHGKQDGLGGGGSFQFSVSMVTSFCPASICVSGVEQRETEQRKKDCGGMKGKQRMKSIYRTREEKREESEKEHGADNGVHGDLVRD